MRSVVRCVAALALVACLAIAGAPATSALENESFGITPFPERANGSDRQSFSIPLETGATFEDAVRIYNLTDEILNLAVYSTDAKKALDDTTVTVGVREEEAEGVGAWIDLSRKSVELEARDAKTITFRVKVGSSDPKPDLGAIVVENLDRGLARSSAQRLYILVRTVPPNTQTSSKRVRTFLVQSPWVAIALVGLVLAGALVWVGARRARRPRDVVVQPGELDALDTAEAPHASRPVIKRLGTSAEEAPHARSGVLERVRASAGAARRRDERPLLDDALLVEVDDEEVSQQPPDDETRTPSEPPARATAAPVRRAQPTTTASRTSPRRADEKPKAAPVRSATPKAKAPAKRSPAKPSPAKRSSTTTRTASKAKTRSGSKPKASSTAKPKPKRTGTRADAAKKNFIPLKDL
jgi:hypothetical protein